MPVFSRFMRYFMVVAQCGSIRRASEELHIAASAIDRQILQGEAALGVPLFERLPTGLRLTPAGECLLAEGRGWMRGMQRVRQQIADLQGLRRGHVTIGLIAAFACGPVPRLVHMLRHSHPGITIRTNILDNQDIAASVTQGDVDYGLMLDPPPMRDLVVVSSTGVSLGFVALPGHPIAALHSARISLCTAYALVMPEPPLALRHELDVLLAGGDIPLEIAASADNVQMIKSLVTEGLGVGILSNLDVMEEVRAGTLCFIPIIDPRLSSMALALVTNRTRSASFAARLVMGEMARHLFEPA
ncbi:LysR family transcriptional regulator [Komagataeibacter medellinensis]|uniref:LysR family transcriptional regulator n=1 Tax=Komagataeibacter medellinensis TaxID=1177712 RepID=A0ABQ6VZF6_9PROT|nr:LysR family transcriptional regulator [Komagataeibacter medellinensis]KAB8124558.1 LysR family transcriptional regulator [Komagataeibacter medellinensis]